MEATGDDTMNLEENGFGDSKKPYNFCVVPFNIEQHLEFIDISKDGHLLLGSSNLVIRTWTGSVWLFKDADVTPIKEEAISGHGCDSPVSCGMFLDTWEKVMIGEDTGKLSVLKLNHYSDGSTHFLPFSSAIHHDSHITSLCVNNNLKRTVSAGNDLRINVWDNNVLELQQKYCPAHSMEIKQVITAPDCNSEMFASCGSDGLALMWDPRQPKPATGIYQSNFGINTITWIDENTLAIGNVASEVELIDVRNKRKSHALKFSNCELQHIKAHNGLLAACGNSNTIKMWDITNNQLVYQNEAHTGFVRWLSWHPTNGKLYSCGFDQRILSHEVGAPDDAVISPPGDPAASPPDAVTMESNPITNGRSP